MSEPADENYFVLVADDCVADRLLLQAAMRHATRLQIIAEVADGQEAVAYLKGERDFNDRKKFPLPDLLLLDLKMPRMDGFEVLEWLKTQSFEGLCIVVLTDSMRAEDIKRALDLGADLFQVKPAAGQDRRTMVLALEEQLTKSPVNAARRLSVSR